MTDYEQPTVGRLSGGVAECSYIRGATHKRTDSAGASVSPLVAEWALDRGADKTTYGYSLPLLVMETQPPLLSNYGQRHIPQLRVTGGAEHSRLRYRLLPTKFVD